MDYSPFYLKNFYSRRREKPSKPTAKPPLSPRDLAAARSAANPDPQASASSAKTPDTESSPVIIQLPSKAFHPASYDVSPAAEDARAHSEKGTEHTVPPPAAPCLPKDGSASKHTRGMSKKKRRVIAAVLVLGVLCAALFAPLFRGESLVTALKADSTADSYWYVVESGYTQRNAAEGRAQAVVSAGGAGYLLNTGEEYLVVLAAYPTRAEGEAVVAKNSASTLIERPLRPIAEEYGAQKKEVEIYLLQIRETLDILYRMSLEIAKGEMTPAAASLAVDEGHAALLNAKVTLMGSANLHSADKRKLGTYSDPLLGGLESLSPTLGERLYLASLRYLYATGAAAITQFK